MKSAVTISVLAAAGSAMAASSVIPSGISTGCSMFLNKLDSDSTLHQCTTMLNTATKAFASAVVAPLMFSRRSPPSVVATSPMHTAMYRFGPSLPSSTRRALRSSYQPRTTASSSSTTPSTPSPLCRTGLAQRTIWATTAVVPSQTRSLPKPPRRFLVGPTTVSQSRTQRRGQTTRSRSSSHPSPSRIRLHQLPEAGLHRFIGKLRPRSCLDIVG
jgi:hypothetical protein